MKLNWKLLCVCACIVIALGAVCPYFTVSAFSMTLSKSLMDSNDGIFVLFIAAVALCLSALGKYLPVIFLGIGSIGLFFVENSSLKTNLGTEADALARAMIQNGSGYYCLLIGSIALIVFAVAGLSSKNK